MPAYAAASDRVLLGPRGSVRRRPGSAAELAAAPGAAGFAAVIDDVVATIRDVFGEVGAPEGPVDRSGPVQREVA